MLSPSRLFFGTDPANPEPLILGDEFSPDDKPGVVGSVLDLLSDSDGEDQTDVPREHSLEASLNESEEEQRSPDRESGRPWSLDGLEGFRGFDTRLGLPDRPPPGLPPLDGSGTGGLGCLAPGAGRATSNDSGGSGDDEDEAPMGMVATPGAAHAAAGAAGVDGVWFSELPSIGSANHFNGTCDRCCFHPKGRCLNGYNCQHCHFDHEKRKRKNKKKTKGKGLALDGEGGDLVSTSADGSLPVSPDAAMTAGTMLATEAEFVAPSTGATSFAQFGMATSPTGGVSCQTGVMGVADFAAQRPPQLDILEEPAPPEVIAYIRQLEEENRYMRACLAQYAGSQLGTPGAVAGDSTVPPAGPLPEASPLEPAPGQPPMLSHLPVQQASFLPPSTDAGGALPAMRSGGGLGAGGLSADAAPFWPGATQAWQEHSTSEISGAR